MSAEKTTYENVRFTAGGGGKKTKVGNDKVTRYGYFVKIDGAGEDVYIWDARSDLRKGATYVAQKLHVLEYPPKEGYTTPYMFRWTEGDTTELEGPKSAPTAEKKSVGDIALSSELLHRGIFEVMREIKILASNAKDEHGDPMNFDGEDIRTMVIQAYRSGATQKMIDLIRAKQDDCPF
jgi:hypothetical protein